MQRTSHSDNHDTARPSGDGGGGDGGFGSDDEIMLGRHEVSQGSGRRGAVDREFGLHFASFGPRKWSQR